MRDDNGCEAQVVDFEIAVAQDTEDPILECPAAVEVMADETCTGIVPDLASMITAMDNCTSPENLTFSQSTAVGTEISESQEVTVTVTDEAGNQASCTTTVNIVDVSGPTLRCPAPDLIIAEDDCQAEIPNFLTRVIAFDNCARGSEITLSQEPAAGTLVDAGEHLVEIKGVDPDGNESSCSVLVTVVDFEPPMLTCPNAYDVPTNEECVAILPDFKDIVTIEDNCSSTEELIFEQEPPAGTTLEIGGQPVLFAVTDPTGNRAECTITVMVMDNTAPTLAVQDLEVSLDENGEVMIAPEDIDTGTEDACGISSLQISRSQFDCDDLGAQEITFEAEDVNGNKSSQLVTVLVKDDLPPSISSVGDISLPVDDSGTGRIVDFEVPSATDNCDGEPTVTLVAGLPPGSVFPAGTTTVEYAAVGSIRKQSDEYLQCYHHRRLGCHQL